MIYLKDLILTTNILDHLEIKQSLGFNPRHQGTYSDVLHVSPTTTLSLMALPFNMLLTPTFTPSPPLIHHRRSISQRRPRFPQHCCLHQRQSLPASQVSTIEASFRSLGADAAADLAYVALSAPSPPPSPTWPKVLSLFSAGNITGHTLSRVARRLSIPALLRLDAAIVQAVLHFLEEKALLTPEQRSRVIAQRPDLLFSVIPLEQAYASLLAAGLQPKNIRDVVYRWPGLLLLDAARITRTAAFLSSRPVGFNHKNLRSLLRRAPWVLVYDIDTEMAPATLFLRDTLGVPDTEPLQRFILASPLLLGTSQAAMHDVTNFLREVVGLEHNMLLVAVRSFPPLLTCSVLHTLEPAVAFLKNEFGLTTDELARVVRAFPAVLTLDVESNMRPVVEYFRHRGVVNVGRIVKRLPPILGYDLETTIIPKMKYVEDDLGLSNFDILSFPGYFSYSMEKCIQPRTKFLQAKGQSVAQWGLNMVLALSDEDFCKRVARAPLPQYYKFRKSYRRQREERVKAKEPTPQENSLQDAVEESTVLAADPGLDWENPVHCRKRRKRRFRATLTRLPWNELK